MIGESDLVIVDPGTPWPDAQAPLWDALRGLQSAGLVPRAIVLTHHHLDLQIAAAELSREFSRQCGRIPKTTERLSGRIVEIARSLHDGAFCRLGLLGCGSCTQVMRQAMSACWMKPGAV